MASEKKNIGILWTLARTKLPNNNDDNSETKQKKTMIIINGDGGSSKIKPGNDIKLPCFWWWWYYHWYQCNCHHHHHHHYHHDNIKHWQQQQSKSFSVPGAWKTKNKTKILFFFSLRKNWIIIFGDFGCYPFLDIFLLAKWNWFFFSFLQKKISIKPSWNRKWETRILRLCSIQRPTTWQSDKFFFLVIKFSRIDQKETLKIHWTFLLLLVSLKNSGCFFCIILVQWKTKTINDIVSCDILWIH